MCVLLATACGGEGTELRGGTIPSSNFKLSVGEARYIGLAPLTTSKGTATLVSLRVEGPAEMEASVVLLDLRRTPPVIAGAVIDRSATVDIEGTDIYEDGPPRYAPTLAVRPQARGTHRLTAVVAEYRANGKRRTQRIPLSFTVTAE